MVGQAGLYRDHSSSLLKFVYFGLFYPSLIFDMFIVVCVCVCVCIGVGVVFGFTNIFFLFLFFVVCVSEYLGEFCGFKFTGSFPDFFVYVYIYIHTHVCIYINIYVCVCVCVCVCVFGLLWFGFMAYQPLSVT